MRDIDFKPCFTSALLGPIKGTTSQMVPKATKSNTFVRFAALSSFNILFFISVFLTAPASIKDTPTAASIPKPLLSSILLGLTIANALGNYASGLWWSMIIISKFILLA